MNILNNITNETINIPELIGLEIGKLIKNKNLLNKYYDDGYKINIDNGDAHLIITYNNDKYDVYIIKENKRFFWLIKSNNKSHYKVKLNFKKNSINTIFFTIKKNYFKKGD